MEIYRDGGGSAAVGASEPMTPSRTGRRRGLSSSSNGIGGIRQQKPLPKASSRHVQDEEEDAHDSKTASRRERRKSTALTPKKPSDMNKKRKRKSLQDKKAAMTFGSDLDKGTTTTTTTKENTSCSSSTSTTKMATSQVVTTSSSRTKIRTPESKIVKPKASLSRIGLSSSDSGSAESSQSIVSTDTNITSKPASTKAHDMSSKASTAGTKTGTTPSSSSRGSSSNLRKFIQQRRKEIRSSAEKDTTSGGNGIVASIDAKDVETVTAPAATAKTVRFEADEVATTRGTEEGDSTGSGTLMDLTDEFRQEVADAKPKPKEELVVPEAGASLEKPSIVTATKTLPTLSLGKFQESLWLDFGGEHRNIVGKTRSMSFLLEAPQNDSEKSSSSSGYYSVEFERVPFKKGFNLIVEEDTSSSPSSGDATSAGARSGGADDSACSRLLTGSNSAVDESTTAGSDRTRPTVLCIKNGDRKRLRLTWTPTEAGGVREVVHLKLPRGRIRITAHGKARAIDNVKKSKKRATNNKTVSRYLGSRMVAGALWATFFNEIFTHKHSIYSSLRSYRQILSTDCRQGKLCQGISPYFIRSINAAPIGSEKWRAVRFFDACTRLFDAQNGVLQVIARWQYHICIQGSSSNYVR